jgi:hypothetical protein
MKKTLFVIAADYTPLQPVEDEHDTVIHFLYPQEAPVRSFCGFVSSKNQELFLFICC